MVSLHWEMSVLSRAVAYPNLSGAASHVGLSQPQLSRIVSKLESEFQITLLDRTARRKSGWTAAAFKLAEVYSSADRKLEGEIQKLVKFAEPTLIRMGTLEGLSSVASRYSRTILGTTSVSVVRLDVHDLNELEELFLSGEMDLVLTSREPGRRKFKHSKEIGFQTLDEITGATSKSNASVRVFSSFEFGTRLGSDSDPGVKNFVSNSLELRKTWIRQFGGKGTIPSELLKQRPKEGGKTVLLIGTDTLSPKLWERVSNSSVQEKESRS
jgi:hypothetical protein